MAGPRGLLSSVSAAAAGVVLLAAFNFNPSQTGAPPKRTGAPGDGTGAPGNSGTCSDVGCHNSFALNSGSGSLTVNAPGNYTPGETIAITVSVAQSGASRFGFEITAKDASGNHQGSWVVGDHTRKTIGNSRYLTHSTTTESEWTFGWQTPTEPVDVTFYVAGSAADGKLDADGDHIYTTTHAISAGTSSAVENEQPARSFEVLSAYPNPVHDRTTLRLRLEAPSEISIRVMRIDGKEVLSGDRGSRPAGDHEFDLDFTGLASGIYVVEARVGGERQTKLLTVINAR